MLIVFSICHNRLWIIPWMAPSSAGLITPPTTSPITVSPAIRSSEAATNAYTMGRAYPASPSAPTSTKHSVTAPSPATPACNTSILTPMPASASHSTINGLMVRVVGVGRAAICVVITLLTVKLVLMGSSWRGAVALTIFIPAIWSIIK